MAMTCSKDRVSPGSKKTRPGAAQAASHRTGTTARPAQPGAAGALADVRLVELAVAGSEEAYEGLFNRYRERVYRIAYSWCFDTQTALDLVQDVFVKAFRSLDKFRRESSIWTWLCRITINRCLDFVRKKERSKEVPVAAPEDVAPYSPKAYADPSQEAELAELKGALAGAIDNLSPEAHAAFTLRFFDNLSYKEIARALDCSVGTVMSRLFYARQKLKTLLQDYL